MQIPQTRTCRTRSAPHGPRPRSSSPRSPRQSQSGRCFEIRGACSVWPRLAAPQNCSNCSVTLALLQLLTACAAKCTAHATLSFLNSSPDSKDRSTHDPWSPDPWAPDPWAPEHFITFIHSFIHSFIHFIIHTLISFHFISFHLIPFHFISFHFISFHFIHSFISLMAFPFQMETRCLGSYAARV